jgi:hypothetical protein
MQKSLQKKAKVTKVFLQASCIPFDRAYSPPLFANFVAFCFNSIRFVANAEEFTEENEGNEGVSASQLYPMRRADSPPVFANFVVFCSNPIRFVTNAEEFTEGSEGNEEKTVSAESGAVS